MRRELYSQCFDELIRQSTINCVERGLLMLRVSRILDTRILDTRKLDTYY